MSVWQVLRIAARTIARHKGRSFLTALGIIIGVAAVIAMVGIGEGARISVQESFSKMGTNLLIVRSGSTQAGGARGGFGSMLTITWDDLHAIEQLPKIRRVAARPEVKMQLASAEANWSTDLGGVPPEFFEIRYWPIVSGRNIAQSDVDAGTKVIVLGQTVVAKLFGLGTDPVGQQVRVGNIPFTVVGVLDHKGQTPNGGDLDDNAYVPLSTFINKIQGGLKNYVNGNVFVSAVSQEEASLAELQIAELLRDRHHLLPGMEDDFQIRNMVEIASAQEEGARTMGALLASVAAVSLVIAGIGIMNIMLVSVTERTREIGLRMAVGARPRDILVQFLIEALALSSAGGLIGVALGMLTSQQMTTWLGWPLLLRPDGIALAVGVSAAVGVIFGLYPAWRAAALDPIEALRFES
jgi:putative ABC transport system permease protein